MRYMKNTASLTSNLQWSPLCSGNGQDFIPARAFRDPITVDDVLNSKMISYPFRKLQCCLVSDGGRIDHYTGAARAKDFPTKPVYVHGTG